METRYAYDLLNRLKHSEAINDGKITQEAFHFDPAGNILDSSQSKNQQNQSNQNNPNKNGQGNRLSFQGDRHFTYDKRGNLIQEKRGRGGKLITRYQYNLNNQLTKIEKHGQTTEYTYDPLGRRIKKQDKFGTTRYLWSGDQLIQEQRNEIKKTYIYEPESFKPLAMVQDGEVYHYHLDHLGTPQELSNSKGNIVWKARYTTYGNVAYKEVDEIENNIRFQGQYFDEESGLHYNRHRYYDPGVGQFTTQDPIGLLGGVNNYQYAPNPTGWIDPFGLSCKENSWNAFQANTKGHFPNSTAASKSFQKMKEVEAMVKVDRPDPSTYLPQSYIDAHVQKFNTEGAGFIAIEGWMENPDYPNLPPRKFVGLRSQMDSVIQKYEASGNDWTVLRDELSLGEKTDLSKESIAYIVIEPGDSRVSYDIPTGKEAGAYKNEWVPGGKTKGGTTEAALVNSEKIFHNNDIDELSEKFPGSKKIK